MDALILPLGLDGTVCCDSKVALAKLQDIFTDADMFTYPAVIMYIAHAMATANAAVRTDWNQRLPTYTH